MYEGWGGTSIAFEDVTGDGYNDLVSVNRLQEYSTPVATYCACRINEGESNPGGFAGGSVTLPLANQAQFGRLRPWLPQKDLALGGYYLSTYLNNCNPNNPLTLNQTLTTYTNNDWISWGDIEGNGFADVVACDWYAGWEVFPYLNNSTNGTLVAQSYYSTGSDANQCQLVDLDKLAYHTLPELCTVTIGGKLNIFNDSGTSPYFSLRQQIQIGDYPTGYFSDYAVGDLNHDDYNDLVIAYGNIYVFLNTGYGTFPDEANQVIETYANSVALGEYLHNGYYDGYPDLLFDSGSAAYIRLNVASQGQTVFANTTVWTGDFPGLTGQGRDLAFADLNGKGSQSVIATGFHSWLGGNANFTDVWSDLSDPPPCPVKHLTLDTDGDHPVLNWDFNSELDMWVNQSGEGHYRVYRLLTQNQYPNEDEAFSLIATVNHDVNSFTDLQISLHQQTYNVRAYYLVKALDIGTHESMALDTMRCTGLYHPNSIGDPQKVSGISLPVEFGYSISPNPFNPTTTISFALPEAVEVSLNVFDISGRLVANLVDGLRAAGQHSVTFDGSSLSSGVYLYSLKAGSYSAIGKMVLLK